MKKPKQIKPFYFKNKTRQEAHDYLNTQYPIKLKHNEELINRVYARYPLIDKAKVSFIVKITFQCIRELLMLGKVLNFNSLFFDTKFHFFKHKRGNKIYPSLKIKISTPPPLRGNNDN